MFEARKQLVHRNLNIKTVNTTSCKRARLSCPQRYVVSQAQSQPASHAASSQSNSSRTAAKECEIPSLVSAMLSDPELEHPEGSDMNHFLKVSEAYWKGLKNSKDGAVKAAPKVVHQQRGPLLSGVEYDVCVCGGTLGVLVALALQQRGHRVCILEKRKLEGRNQEWNTGREELHRLVAAGLLTEEEVERCIVSEFNPVRVGLRGMKNDLWVRDVLNLGVQPRLLLDQLKRKFVSQGGALFEHTAFKSCEVFEDGVRIWTQRGSPVQGGGELPLSPGDANRPLACSPRAAGSAGAQRAAAPSTLTCRLVLDCMGHYSPIVKQMRGGAKPQGMVVVVGGCMGGVPPERNISADLLYSMEDSVHDMQWFWEAFPAAGGDRTAYMFAYTDAHPDRPSFAAILDKYFRHLPDYQGVPLEQLKFRRVLFGAFPCYPGASPLPPAFDRVLQIGDAAAGQSPLSFGGFGSMLRHLPRLADSVHDALEADLLGLGDLAWIQPYQPSLSAAWLFQRAMSVGAGQLRQDKSQDSVAQQLTHPASQLQSPPRVEESLPEAHHSEESAGNAIVAATGLRHPAHAELSAAERQHARRHATWAGASSLAPAASLPSAAMADVLLSLDDGPAVSGRWPPQGADCMGGETTLQHPNTRTAAPWQQGSAADCHPSGSTAPPATAAATQSSGASHGNSSINGSIARDDPEGQDVASSPPSNEAPLHSSRSGGFLSPGHVNRLLRANFEVMGFLGDGVLRPFLQDTLRFRPLALTMAGMSFRDPLAVITVVRHLGLLSLLDWFRHFVMLGTYTLLHCLLSPLRMLVASTRRQPGDPSWAARQAVGEADAVTHNPEAAGVQGEAGQKGSLAAPCTCEGGQQLVVPPMQAAASGAQAGRWWWAWLQQLVVRLRYVFLRFTDALAYGSGCK